MKILIIGFAKVKYMPYINFYLENFLSEKNEVHVLYWNRDVQQEDLSQFKNVTFHEFKYYQDDDVSKTSKIKNFAKFRAFAKDVIKKGNYDFLCVMQTLTAVVIADILTKKFKNRYIFDYRDSTYEGFAPFKKIVAKIVKNSKVTFVSSDSFRKFLPSEESEKIITSHNILTESLNHREDRALYGTSSEKIRVSFWGFIRHEEVNLQLIKQISKDNRFELHYYGREQQIALNLKKYVENNNISNVFFHGEYKPEDRYEFVKNTDLIHNIYYDSNMLLAMGNKYYDGIIFKLPQLCIDGSFMGQLCEETGTGLVCDIYAEDFTQRVFDYYKNLNATDFEDSCDKELRRVLKEYESGSELIKTL